MDYLGVLTLIVVTITLSPWTIYIICRLFKTKQRIVYGEKDVILITGCDSGIGLELADHLTRKYNVQVLACLLEVNVNSAGHKRLTNLMKERCNLHIHKLDVRFQEDINDLVAYYSFMKKAGKFNKLVALINNAGVLVYGEFDWLTWPQINNQVQVNLLGPMAVTRSLINELIEAKGRIINFTSVCERIVMPGTSVYAATKAGLVAFSNVIGFELEKFGIKTIRIKLGDFAKLTNIMARHESNKLDMWNNLDDRKRSLYDNYFDQFHELVKTKMGFTGVSSYEESTLFEDLENAIFLHDPPNSIMVTPFKFKLVYIILEKLPLNWLYTLLRKSLPISLNSEISNKTSRVNGSNRLN